MYLRILFLLLVISIRKVTSRDDLKTELLITLKRLQNVLNDLETNRFVIIDMSKNRKIVKTKPIILKNNTSVKSPEEGRSHKDKVFEGIVTAAPSQTERKVACYMSQGIPEGLNKYPSPVKGLNSRLCTYVILKDTARFISTDDNTVSIDLNSTLSIHAEITELQSNGIAVLSSLSDDKTMEFCNHFRLAISSKMRTTSINNIIMNLKKHGLDGLDIEWTHPGCCKGECAVPMKTSEKPNFTLFLKELYIQAKKYKMFISLVLRPGHIFFSQFYEPEVSNFLDWISVPAFDFHGPWESKTGHTAPNSYLISSINSVLRSKIDARKILFGIPFFARSYNLKRAQTRELGSASGGNGKPGKFLNRDGYMAYYEVCADVSRQKDWTIVRSVIDGSYAVRDTQWISYVDANSIRYRINSMKNIGGAAIWEINLDDYANICKCGQYPLLHAVNNITYFDCA